MEDADRQKKLQAGKEKLAAFKKKRSKKKRRKPPDGGDSDMSDVYSETSSVVDPNDIGFTSESDADSVTSGAENAAGEPSDRVSAMAYHKATQRLGQATNRITELEESLMGKEAAMEGLMADYESLKAQLDQSSSATIDVALDLELPVPDSDDIDNIDTVDQFQLKLQEFKTAVTSRDEVIQKLTANLQATTENRDSLQAEYISQASQLAQEVQMLQAKLKEAGQQLSHPGMTVHLQALMEAKNEMLALQSSNKQKDEQLYAFSSALQERDSIIQQLSAQVRETTNKCTKMEADLLRKSQLQQTVSVDGIPMDVESVKKITEEYYVLKQREERNVTLIAQLETKKKKVPTATLR